MNRSHLQGGPSAAAVVLALLAFAALFGDLLVSHAPLLYRTNNHWIALPDLTAPERVRGRSSAEIDASTDRRTLVVWPPVTATHDPQSPVDLFEATRSDYVAWWLAGTRSAMLAGLLATLASLGLGVTLGGLAGTGPPVFGALLRRLVELGGAAPALLLVVALHATGRFAPWLATALAISLIRGIEIGRAVTTRARQCRSEPFMAAARAIGSPRRRLFLRELAPHVLPAALVSGTFAAAAVVALDAAVAFLGLAPQPAHLSWGGWLGQAARHEAWGAALWPAGGVISMTAALYTLAEGADRRLRAGDSLVSLARSRSRTK